MELELCSFCLVDVLCLQSFVLMFVYLFIYLIQIVQEPAASRQEYLQRVRDVRTRRYVPLGPRKLQILVPSQSPSSSSLLAHFPYFEVSEY